MLPVLYRRCLSAALWLTVLACVSGSATQAAVIEAWVQRYATVVSNSNDEAVKVIFDGAGDIIVTGSTDDPTTSTDMLTIKCSGANGHILWQQRYNGPANGDDFARAVAVDDRGNVVVTGSSTGNRGSPDYYTAKYAAADGALLWEKRYDGPAGSADSVAAVAVDGSGNVIVTGHSESDIEDVYDYYTAKYAAADGALLWEHRSDRPGNVEGGASGVAVDGSGNVVVTGFWGAEGGGWNFDYYTVKYAAADGALLWEKGYNGSANRHDHARAVVLDGSGNAVVTGDSEGDYYTAKYAAADGALLWEKRYSGETNGDDQGQGVAVDASGNVVVTGSSHNAGHYDYYTAKYAAVDGALLWETRYNGPSNSSGDFASALAVDGNGDVVVTGESEGDYYTARYAAANGTVLWETRYNGPANREDFATSVAIGANGMVAVTGGSDGDYATVVYRAPVSPDVAGPLIVTVGGQIYQDWSVLNVRWGTGYPSVDVLFDRDEAIGGQLIWDNEIVRGSNLNDQPEFIGNYTSNLRVNALVADFGEVRITYDLEFPTQLLDLMVLDVDDEDHVRVECRAFDGTLIEPRQLQRIMEGDLSRFSNAPGRPASEVATPPVWNPVAGTLTAAVTWNENRSFTVLRPTVPVGSITLRFAGKRTGAHVYAGLWATPRALELTEIRRTATETYLRWTSLPGVAYRVMRSSNLVDWAEAWGGNGAAPPELTTEAVITSPETASANFFRIQRW